MRKSGLAGWRWFWLVAVVLVCGCPNYRRNPCHNPKFVQALKEQAIAYYQRGQYIEALKAASDAAACKPKDPELYYWLGLIYFQRGKYYEAIASFQKSLSIDPKYVESHMGLGVVYLSLERWDEAIREFEAAAHNDYFTRPWEAYNNLGWAYLQKGDLALSEVNFREAIRLNPRFCPAYCNLGELYARQQRSREAMEQYRQAINICLNNYARPHFLLGLEYGRLNQIPQACAELAIAAQVEGAPEAAKALEYMRAYNCPAPPPGLPN